MNYKRYGMSHSTIRYWQNHAYSLRLYNGIYYAGWLHGDIARRHLQTVSARTLGHDAIAAAFVRRPDEMKRLLEKGER